MNTHEVVDSVDWMQARKQLLEKEKDFTRAEDALAKARQELPWERVEKSYVFDGPAGEESLGDLFGKRSQLIVYHFMFAPDWEAGCKACTFWADNFERIVIHVEQRDAAFVAISRAPYEKLAGYRKRMGWTFKWVSSNHTDFNFDYQVSFDPSRSHDRVETYNYAPKTHQAPELPGISVFCRDGASIYHTYSTYGRGIEMMNTAYHYLDLLPKGRDEDGNGMAWLRRRDEYDVVG